MGSMELTSDLIAVQGILTSLVKHTGEFTKINYRGGNEDKILDVMVEIQKFISHPDQGYMCEGKVVQKYDAQLQDIVIFLALNTTFKHPLDLPEYSHLMNIMPPISKCLFVNIVYGLDLCKHYCKVIEVFPFEFSTELLDETIPCLTKSVPKAHLDNARLLLRAAATKLLSIDSYMKVEDDVDNISEVTNIILQNLAGMYSDQIKDWKAVQIYQHMGYCLLHLFELLLYCDKDHLSLRKFIKNILRTCCTILRNVTVKVYCTWAEVQEEDQILQTVIASKAFIITEKYQKYPEAKELMSMLGPIARKPLTLTEQIHKADVATMIRHIDKGNEDQRNWFKALLSTNVFKDETAVECVKSWYHLCTEEDVSLLLDLCVKNNFEHKELVMKCAASLPVEKLILVATRHFYKNKFVDMAPEGIAETLAITFNKINGKNIERPEDLTSELVLQFLQSPELVLSCLYLECLKNAFYTYHLKHTFVSIREIVRIDNIGVTVLLRVVDANLPNTQNVSKYVELFTALVDTEYFSHETMLLKVLYPLLKRYHEEENLNILSYFLQILWGGNITISVVQETKCLVTLLLTIMNDCRCRFLNFSGIKQHIVSFIVDVFCDSCRINVGSEVEIKIDGEDSFTEYYRRYLTSPMEASYFRSMCPEFRIDNYGDCVNQILQILPSSVTREWLRTADGLIESCGRGKCAELVTDVMILLAQLIGTQTNGDREHLFLAMKYCLQNYGLIIQHRVQYNSTIDTERIVNLHVCRLLAKLPNRLKEEDGFSLVSILTDRSMKTLGNDKDFLCRIILIRNAKICQVLAKKIASV